MQIKSVFFMQLLKQLWFASIHEKSSLFLANQVAVRQRIIASLVDVRQGYNKCVPKNVHTNKLFSSEKNTS